MLGAAGFHVELDDATITIAPGSEVRPKVPEAFTGLNRIPILMLGPLLHLTGEAFVPLVGAPAAMVVAMIVALATRGFVWALLVGLGIALIGQFEGHVLQPLVMGRQVSLHPIVVALAVATGGLVAGIFGAVVVVPLVSVTWAVFSRLRTQDPPMGALEIEAATG